MECHTRDCSAWDMAYAHIILTININRAGARTATQ